MNSSVPDAQTEFDQLQKKLVPLWKSIERFNQDPQTIVVVPSMSIDAIDSGAVIQAYEERFLFLLLLLRQPRARLIYVTSRTILPSIIDYYLDLLPGVIPSHARQRLFLPSPMDGSVRPLSEKLLERPRLIERIRSLIMDPDRAHLFHLTPRTERKNWRYSSAFRCTERTQNFSRWEQRAAAGKSLSKKMCRILWAARTLATRTNSSVPSWPCGWQNLASSR